MKSIKRFLIIGGDIRQIYVADKLKERGFEAELCGFDLPAPRSECKFNMKPPEMCLADFDAVILPLPVSRDTVHLNAPFSSEKIKLAALAEAMERGTRIFCGMMPECARGLFRECEIFDYFRREEFEILNALPTAEGVLGIAVEKLDVTVAGAKILVAGYGKTGKAISRLLGAMGADVTVAARSAAARASAKINGCTACGVSENMLENEKFDMLVNTIPAPIFTRKALAKADKNILLVEIASPPYGIDFNAASDFGLKTVLAGSLPGKVAPKTAGGIICDTILNIIEEERECKT